jgi:hypothetical protein
MPDLITFVCGCRRGVAGHSACPAIGRQGVGRVAYLYASMRGPDKKIDAAWGMEVSSFGI